MQLGYADSAECPSELGQLQMLNTRAGYLDWVQLMGQTGIAKETLVLSVSRSGI